MKTGMGRQGSQLKSNLGAANQTQNPNTVQVLPQTLQNIDDFVDEHEEAHPLAQAFYNGASMKFKEIIRETLGEASRLGNFIRIYPSKTSHKYDRFFASPRPYNKFIYKVLYSQDVLDKQYMPGVIPEWVGTQIDQLAKQDPKEMLL